MDSDEALSIQNEILMEEPDEGDLSEDLSQDKPITTPPVKKPKLKRGKTKKMRANKTHTGRWNRSPKQLSRGSSSLSNSLNDYSKRVKSKDKFRLTSMLPDINKIPEFDTEFGGNEL
jgi:hypothetical protein